MRRRTQGLRASEILPVSGVRCPRQLRRRQGRKKQLPFYTHCINRRSCESSPLVLRVRNLKRKVFCQKTRETKLKVTSNFHHFVSPGHIPIRTSADSQVQQRSSESPSSAARQG